ncbi:MAG: hypothetical protein J07HR59_01075 [Halorubrum sp. J07HR59]|nr:MAG: hypothetical protein J07HR59_01075 [Halorubrum sp. J07HR59]
MTSRAGWAISLTPSVQPPQGKGESLGATCHAAGWAAVVCEEECRDPLVAILSVSRFPAAAHRMSVLIYGLFGVEWNG